MNRKPSLLAIRGHNARVLQAIFPWLDDAGREGLLQRQADEPLIAPCGGQNCRVCEEWLPNKTKENVPQPKRRKKWTMGQDGRGEGA